ncbi:MAG: hypothetical protein QOE53_1435 [Pseudonocardiales bacterium]|jgi:hypothetical protein|nr:hypothetical protein [Pseudonocardiales bacterium]
MNTVDDRISAALHARAEALTEADLSPASPPVGRSWAQPARARWAAPLLAAAIVGIVAAATVTAVELSRSHHASPAIRPTVSVTPSPSGVAPTPSASSPAPSQSASQPAPSQSASQSAPSQSAPSQSAPSQSPAIPPFKELGVPPLWPFGSYAEAEQWRTKGGGSQPWHLDPAQTALNFTRSYLGFTELDQTDTPVLSDAGAHVGVGYLNPNGQLRIAGVLHLVRYGDAKDSPWEVVGSDDITTFTLEQPAYGSRVSSPMTVGGHITGVDENIVVSVIASQTDRATLARVPAGGDNSPWTTGQVLFGQRGVLTIVASTGGHLQQVERFAIQGVHT